MQMTNIRQFCAHSDSVNELLARYGVKFGIYKNNTFKEQLFPFDMIPRVIEKDEFDFLERGLKQRVKALNEFIKDIYAKKQIVKDGIIPEEFIYAGGGYLETPHLDKIVDEAYLLDILLGVLAHLVARRLGLEVRKLALPIPEQALIDVEHGGHLAYTVINFQILFCTYGHNDALKFRAQR